MPMGSCPQPLEQARRKWLASLACIDFLVMPATCLSTDLMATHQGGLASGNYTENLLPENALLYEIKGKKRQQN